MGDIAADDDDLQLILDQGAVEAHLRALFNQDFDKAHRVYRKDAVLKRPQYNLTISGRDNIKAARRERAERRLVKVNSVAGQGDLWVAECVFSDGKNSLLAVSVMEFSNGQIVAEREYFCDLPLG